MTPEKMTPARAFMSSTYKGQFAANQCIDGKIKNTKSGKYNLCHSNREPAPWIALDYGKEASVSVEKVVLFNRWDGSWHRTKNVQIRISNELPTDGKTMFTGGEALGTFKGPATKGQIVEIPSGEGWEKKTGRYVIIQMNHNDYLNLHETYAVGISHVDPSRSLQGKVLSILHGANELVVAAFSRLKTLHLGKRISTLEVPKNNNKKPRCH